MKLSVIVPTYNRQHTLEACLSAIRNSNDKDCEIIVVDDAGVDRNTLSIAKKYADEVIEHTDNQGAGEARNTGVRHAKGELLLFIDSDVVVRPDTITKIKAYFSKHPNVDALSGILSKEHPYLNFFSQYKNLYMHYIFSKLPERIYFLYGSVHAVRRTAIFPYGRDAEIAEDSALGQRMTRRGRVIAFSKDLEVVHHKKHGLFSFIANDFTIPFGWTRIFLKYAGWKQVGRKNTGFLHSPKEQLASVLLAPLVSLLFAISSLSPVFLTAGLFLFSVWVFLNLSFLSFLAKERGFYFVFFSFFVTFLDHLVMASGISVGLVAHFPMIRIGARNV